MPDDDGPRDPYADAVFNAVERGEDRPSRRPFQPRVVGDNRPLQLQRARRPDPASIAPRQWLYGTQLLRGFVSILVAQGGTGKSTYAMSVVLALVSGMEFLGEHIWERVNGSIINLEDPLLELERREAAIRLKFGIPREALDGLFLNDAEERRLVIAQQGPDGFEVVSPDEEALILQIRECNIGVLVVDPFAESHTLEENSNPLMVQALAVYRRVARATNCAILLVHHVRKGEAITIESARGAKAVTDSARVGLLMTAMAELEALRFKVPIAERSQYVRLDDAKRNMAPAGSAQWFRIESVALGNGSDRYVNGDKVGVVVPWRPPPVFEDLSVPQSNAVLDEVDAGVAANDRFSRDTRGRWLGNVIMQVANVRDVDADQIIKTWCQTGLLLNEDYVNFDSKRRKGLRVNPERPRPTETQR